VQIIIPANGGIKAPPENKTIQIKAINTPKFESTFADNSDYIYKTRNYNGPVDIQKISIKLLNMQGTLVYLHDFDFGFNLQVTTIYDITKPYTSDYSII